MKKYSNIIIIIITFIILILVLLNKTLVTDTILSSLYIWLNTLVPSMMPMLILSDILINYNFITLVPSKITNIISKIFNISSNAVLIIFICLISGFPSNASSINTAHKLKLISTKEASHLLLFTHFANPLFVLQTVGVFYLKNSLYGIIILISHILSSFLIGVLLRSKNNPTKQNYISKNNNCQSFNYIFTNSIKKSISTLLMVSVVVSSFLVISSLLSHILNLNIYLSTILQGILEMTMGLSKLSHLPISNIQKIIFSSAIISFGGLSIHMQVSSLLEDIPYSNYLKGRILHALISIPISYIISIILL